MLLKDRAGTFVSQPSGYKSFKPNPLPPEPPLELDAEMIKLLSDADRKLGRLDGITQVLPDPELFLAMYVQKEALLSSQLEGTQASLSDVLGLENNDIKNEDVREVVNYVAAMNYGLKRLDDLPISLRLIKEIHSVLLLKGRGSNLNPGEFRTSQNWVGPKGCGLTNATYVPPTVPDMKEALGDLELFIHEDSDLPALIKIALIHAQFESIHPFLDGNGRVGRLLITFWLCNEKILSKPLLYLSYYFKQNRIEYYDRLMDVRLKGDWEGWVKYFLRGIAVTSEEATESGKAIIALKQQIEARISKSKNSNYQKLLDNLFTHPQVTNKSVTELLGVSLPTANSVINWFIKENILEDVTPERKRNKRYVFAKYLIILSRGTELEE